MLSVLSNPAYSLSCPIIIKFDETESISSLLNRDSWGRGGRIGCHRDLYPTVCIVRQEQWQINTLAQIFFEYFRGAIHGVERMAGAPCWKLSPN